MSGRKRTQGTPAQTGTSFGGTGVGGGFGGNFGTGTTSQFGTPQANGAAQAQPQQPQEPPTYDKSDTQFKTYLNNIQKVLFEYRELAEVLTQRTPERIDSVREQADFALDTVDILFGSIKTEFGLARNLKEDFQRLTRNIDNVGVVLERAKNGLDNPATSIYGFGSGMNLPSRFFKDLSEEFDSRMQQHQQSLDSLEKFLETAAEKHDFSPPMLKDTMKNQLEYFLALSASVSALHERVLELQNIYLARRRSQGDLENPFLDENERKRRMEDQKRKKQQVLEMMRNEELKRAQQIIQQQQQQQQQAGQAKPGSTFGGFGTGSTTGGTAGFGGSTFGGGFGTPAAGTTSNFGGSFSTPAAGTNSTTSTPSAKAAGAAFGFAPAANTGFGTPAAGTGAPATSFGGTGGTTSNFGFGAGTGAGGFGTPAKK